MAKKNSGKIFEKVFKDSADNLGICIDRLKDASDISAYKSKKNSSNIADFIMYEYPNIFYLELKVRTSTRINFCVLTDDQYNGLLKKHYFTGVHAGVVFLYLPNKDCFYVPIHIIKLLKDSGVKSLRVEDCEIYGVRLIINKKRVSYTVDLSTFKADVETKDWQTISRGLMDNGENNKGKISK